MLIVGKKKEVVEAPKATKQDTKKSDKDKG